MNLKSRKVCMIFNGAPDYRRAIYLLIDENYDCDWYFIKSKTDDNSKEMNINLLKSVYQINEIPIIKYPITYQKGLLKLLFDNRYDSYFMAGSIWSIGIWLFCIFKKLFYPRKKIYFWTHGILRVRKFPMNIVSKLFFNLADYIFTYGDRAKTVMIGEGFDENKIWPIHNSLDYDTQVKLRNSFDDIYVRHFNNTDPVIFFIGRLTPVKKLDMLVEAFNNIITKGKHANLVFIGDGTVKEQLTQMVSNFKIEDRVWFYGKCYNEEEKSKLITNADICVAPGNIGLTAMDSLVYGTPCITMNNFGMQMPEHEAIVEGETGAFFVENDVVDLSNKICQWLEHNYNRDVIRQNCYSMIDNYWNPKYQIKIIKKHLDI